MEFNSRYLTGTERGDLPSDFTSEDYSSRYHVMHFHYSIKELSDPNICPENKNN